MQERSDVLMGFTIGCWVVAAVLFLIGYLMLATEEIFFGLLFLAFGVGTICFWVHIEREYRRVNAERKQKVEERNKREWDIYHQIEAGKWPFPTEEFYRLCHENHIKSLNSEFSQQKAKQFAIQLIQEIEPDISVNMLDLFLSKDRLDACLKEGVQEFRSAEARKLEAQKEPRKAKADAQEDTFMERARMVSKLRGSSKRKQMLTNLIADYDNKIQKLEEGEKALIQLGMIYASQQQKESDWAIIGGIAEGIAGPAAGLVAAANTMANNTKIREHNAAVRKTSMEIMSGVPGLLGDICSLEKEREQIRQQLCEAQNKVVLSKPSAKVIWENIKLGKATVTKKTSGVLAVALPITFKEAFALDVPDGVSMVVDGTIKGEVWFEDKLVGDVLFPLPLYGIPSNMTAEITLDGMCDWSVEYNGKYNVKIADEQNLWIMETQFTSNESSYISSSNKKDQSPITNKSNYSHQKTKSPLSVDAALRYYKSKEWEDTKDTLLNSSSWKDGELRANVLYCISKLKIVCLSDLTDILDQEFGIIRKQITPMMEDGNVTRIEQNNRAMFVFSGIDE